MTPPDRKSPPLVAIVDDEGDVITYLRVALEDHGYEVAATSNSSEAPALLEHSEPDLICLDLLMPGQTGVSLYAELRRHPKLKNVPILIVSGLAVRDELPGLLKEAGDLPGPAHFIEKPVDIELFLEIVDGLIGSRSDRRSTG